MMMKGMLVGGGGGGDQENMSNITCASNEGGNSQSVSSSSGGGNHRNEIAGAGGGSTMSMMYPPLPQSLLVPTNNINSSSSQPTTNTSSSTKRKRNLPGNPDPEADVIALSPKSLMATNRFICEICNKGFQRDQNLQLHRRGHNLPWKLKQRSKLEVIRKKVYVCPETTCVHHDPSRALGDLTGIKKHFSRKHGEKKWKCEKCSKRYAVQSDWKAHSKICGTREYRCDCGTLFSRRDSFITHRAFCDALAEESAARSSTTTINPHLPLHLQNLVFPLKVEQNDQQDPTPHQNISFNLMRPPPPSSQDHHNLPPWLNPQNTPNPNPNFLSGSSSCSSPPPSSSSAAAAASHHMSATALLQKAAQMGVTMSKPSHTTASQSMFGPGPGAHQQVLVQAQQAHHMCAPPPPTPTAGNSLLGNLSTSGQESQHQHQQHHGFVNVTSSCMEQVGAPPQNNSMFDHHGFVDQGTTFEEALNGMLNSRRDQDLQQRGGFHQEALFSRSKEGGSGGGGGGGGGNEEMTRDFLGLRGLIPQDHREHFLSMAGFDHINSSSSSPFHHQQQQNQTPWQG